MFAIFLIKTVDGHRQIIAQNVSIDHLFSLVPYNLKIFSFLFSMRERAKVFSQIKMCGAFGRQSECSQYF
jgi:hypothetical protein